MHKYAKNRIQNRIQLLSDIFGKKPQHEVAVLIYSRIHSLLGHGTRNAKLDEAYSASPTFRTGSSGRAFSSGCGDVPGLISR